MLDERDAVIGRLRRSVDYQLGALSAAETRVGNDVGLLRSDLHRVHRAALEAQALAGSVRTSQAGGTRPFAPGGSARR